MMKNMDWRIKKFMLCMAIVLLLTAFMRPMTANAANGAGTYLIGSRTVTTSNSNLKYYISAQIGLSKNTTSQITITNFVLTIQNLASNPITYAFFDAEQSNALNYVNDELYFSIANGVTRQFVVDWGAVCEIHTNKSTTYSKTTITTVCAGPGSVILHGWSTTWAYGSTSRSSTAF